MKRMAVLSNINIDSVIKGISKNQDVYAGEGYGNELELLLNPSSSLHAYKPDMVFLVIDLLELTGHQWDRAHAVKAIDQWYEVFAEAVQPDCVYFIPDVCLRGKEWKIYSIVDPDYESVLSDYWQQKRKHLMQRYENTYAWSYRQVMHSMAETEAYSDKMWYLGKMIHSRTACIALQKEIIRIFAAMDQSPKKLLLLDLDNTLWGGLAGERDHQEIQLSEEKTGMVYKDLQRVIKVMKEAGVMLGIVSKNNEKDGLDIIRNHPHMVLREQDFVAMQINWKPKSENIQKIAKLLNIGLDSIVFWDDNELEREEVRQMLPMVTVPEFPAQVDKLPEAMYHLYHQYFSRVIVTREDRNKSEQYRQEQEREEFKQQSFATDFAGYLKSLEICLERVDTRQNIGRLVQLLNKTNQFNLMTNRYEYSAVMHQIENNEKEYYMYRISDRFGDAGIVGIVGARYSPDGLSVQIEDFVMSCRVMGRFIEYAILDQVENDIREKGYHQIFAAYRPTAKNKPVEHFWDQAGYQLRDEKEEQKEYDIVLEQAPKREYYVQIIDKIKTE